VGDAAGRGKPRAAEQWGTRAAGRGGRSIPRSPHRGDARRAQPRSRNARNAPRRHGTDCEPAGRLTHRGPRSGPENRRTFVVWLPSIFRVRVELPARVVHHVRKPTGVARAGRPSGRRSPTAFGRLSADTGYAKPVIRPVAGGHDLAVDVATATVWRGTRHRSWRLDTHSIAKPVAGERASSGPEARPRSRTPRIREDLGRSRGLLRERNEGRARLVPGTLREG
jgi:hypothetical protein